MIHNDPYVRVVDGGFMLPSTMAMMMVVHWLSKKKID